MLNLISKVISELQINKDKITSNIDITKGQIYAEFVLEALVKKRSPGLMLTGKFKGSIPVASKWRTFFRVDKRPLAIEGADGKRVTFII